MSNTQQQNVSNTTVEKSFAERVAEAKAEVSSISAAEAYERQRTGTNVLFIDPRPADAIRETTGMIPGGLNVTLDRLNAAGDLPSALSPLSRPIITACQAGPMGALAAQALKNRGFENVVYLDGGTQAWLDAGFGTEH